jgi:1-acyl-sn-glycerol-3-phosphate acyltransferase
MDKEYARNTFGIIFKLLDVHIFGQENFRKVGKGDSAIIAFFPHTGHLDAPFVRMVVPEDLRNRLLFPAASDYWFRKDLLSVARNMASSFIVPAFPISRSGASHNDIMDSLSVAETFLSSGHLLVLSPEGTRSALPLEDRILKTGIAELIIRTQKPVIPVLLEGFIEILPRGTAIPRFFEHGQRRSVSAIVGEPIDCFINPNLNRSGQRKDILEKLRATFLDMVGGKLI